MSSLPISLYFATFSLNPNTLQALKPKKALKTFGPRGSKVLQVWGSAQMQHWLAEAGSIGKHKPSSEKKKVAQKITTVRGRGQGGGCAGTTSITPHSPQRPWIPNVTGPPGLARRKNSAIFQKSDFYYKLEQKYHSKHLVRGWSGASLQGP